MLAQPLGAVRAAGFLVGHAEVDQVAGGTDPLLEQMREGHRHRRGHVEHVDRAAPPDLAFDEFAAEGVAAPAVGRHRDDVGVAHPADRGRVGIAAFDPSHHGLAAEGRFERLDVRALPLEERFERVAVAHLVTRCSRPVVHALIADQRLEEFDGLSGQRAGSGIGHHDRI